MDFPLHPSLKHLHTRALIKLSRISGLYPESMILKGIKLVGDAAVKSGGFADVWRALLGGQEICVKILKVYSKSDHIKLRQVGKMCRGYPIIDD